MNLTWRGRKCVRMSTNSGNDHDFLSKLPEDILLMILDKLPMEEAVATSLLSRTWRDLWKFMSKVDFTYQWVQEVGKEITPSLNQFVHQHQGQKIRSCRVSLRYNKSMLRSVKSWISFAVEKNVEELYLDLNDINDRRKRNSRIYPFFRLPNCLFSSSTLTRMTLKFLDLELPQSIYLRTLRELYLDRTTFRDDAIQKITASCPVLELLILSNCNMTQNININVAPNSKFLKLIIREGYLTVSSRTNMFINAPKVRMVEFCMGMTRRSYSIENVPVGVEVRFNLYEMLYYRRFRAVTRSGLTAAQYDRNIRGLLDVFRTAKALHLSSWAIQVLSVKKVMNQEILSFNLTTLVLDAGLLKWELPGIAYLLRACPRLENLVILMVNLDPFFHEFQFTDAFKREYDFNEASYWRQRDIDFVGCLERLHSVEFRNPYAECQIWVDVKVFIQKFFTRYKNGIELFGFLMRNSPNLEKVAFNRDIFGPNQKRVSIYRETFVM